jgi:outer membrane biosynthesis protein TonB
MIKNIIIGVLIVILLSFGGWIYFNKGQSSQNINPDKVEAPTAQNEKRDQKQGPSPYEKSIVKPFIVKNAADDIQKCYKSELAKNSQFTGEGTVELGFRIETDGTVKYLNIISDSLNSKTLNQCIEKSISKIKFPEPPNSTFVDINHKFLFKKE